MRIEYHPAIERELREITKYYNECSPGLGVEFLNEFERQILRIASMPTRWMAVESNVRRSLMKRFPYVIYFRVLDNDTLRVTVVKHQRRHPDYGLNRR
ncbi:type II toxin-antitoxin system RelE/ParE family toxin [candidate division KSB1 bacterium]|nr:type II toxin-antitoxin system RelE/ParE family toxin [candidate division KSB1 bacterium]MBL7092400.1 type II toxin-antitoxin system RelE/ParE family toxin [candidate division KSB1 bacterium]